MRSAGVVVGSFGIVLCIGEDSLAPRIYHLKYVSAVDIEDVLNEWANIEGARILSIAPETAS